jgi:hypothetical protein
VPGVRSRVHRVCKSRPNPLGHRATGALSPPRGAQGHPTTLSIMTRNYLRTKTFPTTPHLSKSVRWLRLCGGHGRPGHRAAGAFSHPRGAQGHPTTLSIMTRNHLRAETFPTKPHLAKSVWWFRLCVGHGRTYGRISPFDRFLAFHENNALNCRLGKMDRRGAHGGGQWTTLEERSWPRPGS